MPGLKRRRTGSSTSMIIRKNTPKYTRTGTLLVNETPHRRQNVFGGVAGTGVPMRMFPIKHRIVNSLLIDPLDGVPVSVVKQINNLSESYGGHQPMGYDQMNALYQFYKVTKAKFTVHFQAMGNASGNDQCLVGIQFTENSSWSPADLETLIERGNCSFKPIALSNGSPSVVTVKKTWDISKWYGPENSQGLSLSGTNSSAPVEVVYAHVFCANGSTSNTSGVWAHIIIDYEVEWFGPLQTNQS